MENKKPKKAVALVLIVTIYVTLISPCYAYSESNTKDVLYEIDKFVTEKMHELRIKGAAVGIIQDGNILYKKGYGISNTQGDPITPDTPFILGSTTKSITALAVMKLVEEGKVNLDDSVQKYLPEFQLADKEVSSRITIRHLLNQTSGIPETAGNSDYLNYTSTQEDFVKRLTTLAPTTEPGQEYQYSEANYVILGESISKVSGLSYEEYIETNIFTPLDMKHSFTSKANALKNGLSTGYRTCFGFPFSSDFPYPKQYVSASYLISSAGDMANYLKMYINNGVFDKTPIISHAGAAELFKPGPKLTHPEGYSYSMGWFVSNETSIHDGRPTNYYSCMVIDNKYKSGVVLLTNTNNRLVTAEYSMPIATGISNLIAGKKIEKASFGFKEMYLVFNLIAITLITVTAIRFTKTLIVIRRRLEGIKFRSKWYTLCYILPDFLMGIIFAGILFYILKSMQISFSIAMLGQPDLAITLIAIITISAVNFLTRTVLISLKFSKNFKKIGF